MKFFTEIQKPILISTCSYKKTLSSQTSVEMEEQLRRHNANLVYMSYELQW